jgi:hypothetical protein
MAAGLGFKDFVTGEVLTAADVDGYLMQNIWVFANATARDAAVTSPQEGNACYLKDTDAVMTYSGSAWVTASSPTSYGYTSGKNRIINGDFGVWQRGTSAFTVDGSYTSDRWSFSQGSTTGAQVTQGVFTAGELSTGGSTSNYYLNLAGTMSSASLGYIQVQQPIEDVRTFENTTAIVSFYAKGSASGTINIVLRQLFGTGGSAAVLTTPVSFNITTSWARYSTTVSIPSVSGKTIGAGSSLQVIFVKNMGSSYPTFGTSNYTGTLSLWGVQLEAGSTATAFQTATGTIQGELAACQRYFRLADTAAAVGQNSTNVQMSIQHTGMRVAPTVATSAALTITDVTTANFTQSSGNIAIQDNSVNGGRYTASNFTGITNNRFYIYLTSGGSIQLSAEL